MLLDTLKQEATSALKSGKRDRVETLRFLLAGVTNSAIAKYGSAGEKSLTDSDVLEVIKKQVKTHKESIEAFEKAGRSDLVEKEKAQLLILQEFLPKQLSDDDLKAILAPIVASGQTNFGLLMKEAMAKVADQADASRVSAMLRMLTSKVPSGP